MIKKVLALLFVTLLIYIFLPDVDYAPGVNDWLSETVLEIPDGDNLFFAITGFTTAENKDPYKEGERLVKAANQALEIFLKSDAYFEKDNEPEYETYWNHPSVTATEDINILCDPRIKDCLDVWTSQKNTIEKSVNDNALLLRRYQELHQYKNYHNTLANDLRSPLPELSNLMAIHRLQGLKIALRFLSGDHEPAMLALQKDMVFTRRLMEQADTLIMKMVAQSMLKHDLYLYATLMDATNVAEKYLFENVPLLSESERSFERPLKYEFSMNAKLIDEISRYPQFYAGDFFFSEWLPFPFFKKNHSTNMIFNAFNRILVKSHLSANEYYKLKLAEPDGKKEYKPDWLAYIFNPIGSILFSISMPDFDKYIIRMHDMDGLITMINLKQLIKTENIKKSDIEEYLDLVSMRFPDPYTGQNIHWNETEQNLWIQNPESDYLTNKLRISFQDEDSR